MALPVHGANVAVASIAQAHPLVSPCPHPSKAARTCFLAKPRILRSHLENANPKQNALRLTKAFQERKPLLGELLDHLSCSLRENKESSSEIHNLQTCPNKF